MSQYEALLQFNRQPVSIDMIQFLVSTTECIIEVQDSKSSMPIPSLSNFIRSLVVYSNVQTPTLMATTVYLTKLRSIIPSGVRGIPTTRHRIFVGCLILASKALNDSSPLNKHWTKYTNGLLQLSEVNTIERELLEYFDWNVMITTDELITSLSPLLVPIQEKMLSDALATTNRYPQASKDIYSRSSSSMSIPSIASSLTISSVVSESSSTEGVGKESTLEALDRSNPYNVSLTMKEEDPIVFKNSRPLILKSRKESLVYSHNKSLTNPSTWFK